MYCISRKTEHTNNTGDKNRWQNKNRKGRATRSKIDSRDNVYDSFVNRELVLGRTEAQRKKINTPQCELIARRGYNQTGVATEMKNQRKKKNKASRVPHSTMERKYRRVNRKKKNADRKIYVRRKKKNDASIYRCKCVSEGTTTIELRLAIVRIFCFVRKKCCEGF